MNIAYYTLVPVKAPVAKRGGGRGAYMLNSWPHIVPTGAIDSD